MNKKAPVLRICCVTREKLSREQLYRIVKCENGIYLDSNQNIKGRGAYIKKDLSTILLGQKKNSLSKALRCKVDDSLYLDLIQALNKEGR